MKSFITIAASSVCKHEILYTDRLNKIQLRTVWCSIYSFYFCSKQTMNVFSHCTFAWINVDFSCKTAYISYHAMSAKTRVLKCCCLLFDWTEFWENSALLNRESWLAYDALYPSPHFSQPPFWQNMFSSIDVLGSPFIDP